MRGPIRLKNLRLRFLPYYVVGAVVILLVRPTPSGYVGGAAIVVLGAALRSWGAGHLVKNDALTITGPYAHLRHPLYLGTLLVGQGFALIVGGWLALAILALLLPWFFLLYFPRKERIESARLERRYAASYALYRAQVPALVPMARGWRPLQATPAFGDVDARWSGERYRENNELGALLAVTSGLVLLALRMSFVS